MKYNIISHITTTCNYNCSYCDVIKDGKNIWLSTKQEIIKFIKDNYNEICAFKFFWWEPLVSFSDIKDIIKESKKNINLDFFEIVTNTSLIKEEHLKFFKDNFQIIYLSIDTENNFNIELFKNIMNNYNSVVDKVYFNLILNPWSLDKSYEQFQILYDLWFRWFNILPVYFTKSWKKSDLEKLTEIIKKILDTSILDKTLRMYWFQKIKWEESKLSYNSLFIDTDWKIYYSDMVSTFIWNKFKNKLNIWDINSLSLQNIDIKTIDEKKEFLIWLEKQISTQVLWQIQLQKIMDYFSKYLNSKYI